MLEGDLKAIYGNRVRIRVCGLYLEDDHLLLIKHRHLGLNGHLWIPPGGQVEFGTSLEENLRREFLEETGLEVTVGEYLCTFEFVEPPLHAIELFFIIDSISGSMMTGFDPELSEREQIIEEVKMMPLNEVDSMDRSFLHGIFGQCSSAREVFDLQGLFKFKNNA